MDISSKYKDQYDTHLKYYIKIRNLDESSSDKDNKI